MNNSISDTEFFHGKPSKAKLFAIPSTVVLLISGLWFGYSWLTHGSSVPNFYAARLDNDLATWERLAESVDSSPRMLELAKTIHIEFRKLQQVDAVRDNDDTRYIQFLGEAIDFLETTNSNDEADQLEVDRFLTEVRTALDLQLSQLSRNKEGNWPLGVQMLVDNAINTNAAALPNVAESLDELSAIHGSNPLLLSAKARVDLELIILQNAASDNTINRAQIEEIAEQLESVPDETRDTDWILSAIAVFSWTDPDRVDSYLSELSNATVDSILDTPDQPAGLSVSLTWMAQQAWQESASELSVALKSANSLRHKQHQIRRWECWYHWLSKSRLTSSPKWCKKQARGLEVILSQRPSSEIAAQWVWLSGNPKAFDTFPLAKHVSDSNAPLLQMLSQICRTSTNDMDSLGEALTTARESNFARPGVIDGFCGSIFLGVSSYQLNHDDVPTDEASIGQFLPARDQLIRIGQTLTRHLENDGLVSLALGLLFEKQEQWQQAERFFEVATQQFPNDPNIQRHLELAKRKSDTVSDTEKSNAASE